MHRISLLQRMALFVFTMLFSLEPVLAQEDTISGNDEAQAGKVMDTVALQLEIVTGYTTQPVRGVSGSVGIVEPNQLTAIPSGNISNQLQGRLSGVTVIGNGQPGAISRVRVRGFTSFINNEPLYVVDGVPTQDISSLNPNDIASLCVLKDAGAASIYGSRASNGVVVITTKSGHKGLLVNYNMVIGTQSPGKGADNLLNTQEFADLQWLVYRNDGTYETHPIYGPSSNPEPTLPGWAANTDWYDAITEKAGMQQHNLSFSGGGEKSRYYAGMGYFGQDGIVVYTHSKKYNAQFNAEWKFLKDRLVFGENLSLSYRSSLGVPNLSEASPIQMGPYRSQSIIPVIITQPITGMSHQFVPGEYGGTGIAPRLGNNTNAFADRQRAKDNTYHSTRLLGSGYLDVLILKGLNFRSTFGGTWNDGYGVTYLPATYENAENRTIASLTENSYYGSDWVWTNALTLNRSFGQHRVLAIAGYEAVKYGMGRGMLATRSGYASDAEDLRDLTNGTTTVAATSENFTPTKLISLFAKIDYAYRDKYLVGASVRRDGCSRFGENNRFGVFPSLSAGWRIGEESFMKSVSFISDMKIRGSYGTMGNQYAISPQNQYYQFGGDVRSSYYDLNGTGNSAVPGYYPIRIGNPDITYEASTVTNIGIEASLWNHSLGITFDWYRKQATDLLFNPALPATGGDAEPPYVNVASMNNSGIDMDLSYTRNWGDLGFAANAIFTTYKNEIVKIADGTTFFDAGVTRIGTVARNQEGHPLSEYYGYKVTGLFENSYEIDAAPDQDGAEPGFFRFANHDESIPPYWDEQAITPADRMFIGNPHPKFTYGINLALTYKGFDIAAFLYGSYGNDIFNWNKWWTDFWPSFQGQKSKDLFYNSWTENRLNTSVPKASNKSNFSTNTVICNYYIEDGSYLRLKNLEIGYTLPGKLLNKAGAQSLRVYIQGINLFTKTKYTGLDPEIGGDDTNFGIDSGNYPNAKQFIFGLNLTI